MSIPKIAIVDYGLGNLFSLARACEKAGMYPLVTSSPKELAEADAVILPGVGAFGNAMSSLRQMNLIDPLRDLAAASKPIIGICLGMQLLLSQSDEFGEHEGLDIIAGSVRSFSHQSLSMTSGPAGGRMKIPQVGWNRVYATSASANWTEPPSDSASLMAGLPQGAFMYFVHSYVVEPADPSVVTGRTRYGDLEFCSALRSGSVFGFQFHPERSGAHGLTIYRNLMAWLSDRQ